MEQPDLDAIKARWEASSKGEWVPCILPLEATNGWGDIRVCVNDGSPALALLCEMGDYDQKTETWTNHDEDMANAEFIASAHQDIPTLLAYIKYLEDERDTYKFLHDDDSRWDE